MLSTNRSTSWPFSSRKYSAMVSPDRATRRRAPGGSFIWPNTSTALSSTAAFSPSGVVYSASFISSQRSLPSRVRSPTPPKTLKPPFSTAVIRISSWISTVLPTPAPPKRPILPPLAKGQSRSTTLMPVSNTSDTASCSTKEGAGRWIGHLSVSGISPSSRVSSGLPSRLKIRPRVSMPTGTEIGPPRSTAVIPRRQPSVEDMATQRAMSLPRCWATSRVSSMPLSESVTVNAL